MPEVDDAPTETVDLVAGLSRSRQALPIRHRTSSEPRRRTMTHLHPMAARVIAAAMLTAALVGCTTSSGTFSLVPAGHYLTEQTEAVLDASPRVAALPRELDKTVLPAVYLEPGDTLLIEPVDFDSDIRLPADQQVLADGTVDLGGYGRVIVAGLTLEQAEGAIEEILADAGEDGEQINVRLLESEAVYYVLGEVSSPGAYPLMGNETVLDGILAAGGLTSRSSPCDILLARPTVPDSCRVTLPICYQQITQLGDTTTNYQLRPGDRVFVGSRTLCDDLAFWRTKQTCERCECRRQRPCPDPHAVQLRNPVGILPAQPPRPPQVFEDEAETDEVAGQTRTVQAPRVQRRPLDDRLPPVAADLIQP